MKKLIVLLVAVAVLGTPALTVPASAAAPAPSGSTGTTLARTNGSSASGIPGDLAGKKHKHRNKKKHKKRSKFRVRSGVVFNNPYSRNQAWRVIDKMKRAIRHVPRHQRIMIMSWNFNAPGIVNELIRAHHRGVGVRVVMARKLVNGQFRRLGRVLATGQKKRPGRMKSFTRTCSNSCRGHGSAMHAKLMLISKSGRSRNIVMQGSANMTTSAGSSQWNDWYTLSGNRKVYRGWRKVFNQALRDRPAKAVQFRVGRTYSWFSPRAGASDPVLSLLRKVHCKRAGKAGIRGRTAIRVASAVFGDKRGVKIARKLKKLHRRGCNVQVVFTMITGRIRATLRGVPTRQMVYDWDHDGAYDRYLHMKAMTIRGRVGQKRQRLVLTSAANWSHMGLTSDEQGMVIRDNGLERLYRRHISWLFDRAPRRLRPVLGFFRARGLPDPYRDLELELPGQG